MLYAIYIGFPVLAGAAALPWILWRRWVYRDERPDRYRRTLEHIDRLEIALGFEPYSREQERRWVLLEDTQGRPLWAPKTPEARQALFWELAEEAKQSLARADDTLQSVRRARESLTRDMEVRRFRTWPQVVGPAPIPRSRKPEPPPSGLRGQPFTFIQTDGTVGMSESLEQMAFDNMAEGYRLQQHERPRMKGTDWTGPK